MVKWGVLCNFGTCLTLHDEIESEKGFPIMSDHVPARLPPTDCIAFDHTLQPNICRHTHNAAEFCNRKLILKLDQLCK